MWLNGQEQGEDHEWTIRELRKYTDNKILPDNNDGPKSVM